jgi:hypothetical protein
MKVSRWFAGCLAAGAILLSGCASGSSTTNTSSLEIISVDPAANASSVPLTSCPTGSTGPCGGAITVTFNRLVAMQAVVFEITPPLSGSLRCPSAGPGVTGCPAGVGNQANQSIVVMYLGMNAFVPDTTYKITVVAAQDTNGNSLPQPVEWTFTTAPS